MPTIGFTNISTKVVEGDNGLKTVYLPLELSSASSQPVTVTYSTRKFLDDATPDVDFVSIPTTQITFAPGETSKKIAVQVIGDTLYEGSETFLVELLSASGAAIAIVGAENYRYPWQMVEIENDDSFSIQPPIVTLSPAFASVLEGETGTKLITLTVTLSAAPSAPVSVAYTTRNGEALAGSDFTAANGTLNFAPGETRKTFTVSILGDNNIEADESFSIHLTSATGAILGTNGTASAIASIVNDDVPAADLAAPTVTGFSPANAATQVLVGSNILFTFNETVQRGTGNIFLKTEAGELVESYNAATSPHLTIAGNTLTINPSKDLDIFTTYKTEIRTGAIKDFSGNDYAGTSEYSFKTATVDGLYHFCAVAFNAAPGAGYMNQLAEAYNSGLSIQQIVNIFSTKPEFSSTYPESLTNAQLAQSMVANVVKGSASEAAKTEAINDIVWTLDHGWSKGDVIFTVFGNLAGKSLADPVWGETALQFMKQTEVARYFTEVMGESTQDLPTLRSVISSVDATTDISTPEQIATLIGIALGQEN